ncbi:MAG: T9SS type A sorting domain-containing protein [Bacteroidales bacterium]
MKTLYTPDNSSLEYDMVLGAPTVKIGGLIFDPQGNLWVTNSSANRILSVRVNDGTEFGEWESFYLGSKSSGKDIGELIVDEIGQNWILWRDHSIIVFNDNNTPLDPADDLPAKYLTGAQNNGNLPGSIIFSLASDLDGEIWIGTDEGIAVIYSPENVFTNSNYDAQRILIPRNDGSGLADILLEFETITAIAVDGKNNKWIGTDKSGVFQVSPDGTDELQHFTTENSPLLSNNITTIDINQKTGEVFFGTANGLISFKSTATEGGTTNSGVYAYPNPVRPGYSGPIAIKGLVNNADFKITNVSGSLVYSGRAEGGQAIWDGKNFSGSKAQSGVYLVFISNDDGKETMVTKILLIN